jgi:SAM-dependent methyltransferase
VHGLDLNPQYLALAQREKQAAATGRLAFTLADAHSLPYGPGRYDLAVCHFLLLWVADPVRVLAEMRRVTRPGGAVLALAEPDYLGRIDHPPELARLGELQGEALRRQGADPALGRKLRSLFTAAGLVDIEMGALGGQWRGAPPPEEFESEWAVLRSDLRGTLDPESLDRLQALDARAWLRGERVLFVPTFYAWGRTPV